MKISEIFYSVQGESVSLGLPAVFVRLSGCSLKCSFCDTKYSWDEGKEMKIKEVLSEIEKYPCKRVVITGGEPLEQKDEVSFLVYFLKDEYFVEVETNGTISPGLNLLTNVDQWNISPKTWQDLKDITQTPQSFGVHTDKLYIKIVVEKDLHQLAWAKKFKQLNPSFPIDHIILMPCATTILDQITLLKPIIEEAKKEGYRVSPRLQILVWGCKKGV